MKRRRTIALSFSCCLVSLPGFSESTASAEDGAQGAEPRQARERFLEEEEAAREGMGAEEEYSNALAFGVIYTRSILRPRRSATGEELTEAENLFGLNLVYDRILIPNHLALGIAKPFLFNRERYDSPLEIVLKALIRRGQWEPFFGLGLHTDPFPNGSHNGDARDDGVAEGGIACKR